MDYAAMLFVGCLAGWVYTTTCEIIVSLIGISRRF